MLFQKLFEVRCYLLVLLGTEGEVVNFSWRNKRGRLVERFFPFEGVLNNVNRRYKETESNYIREELSKLISLNDCQLCDGTRLREEARNVFIQDNSLPEITCLTIYEAFKLFSNVLLESIFLASGLISYDNKMLYVVRVLLEAYLETATSYASLTM